MFRYVLAAAAAFGAAAQVHAQEAGRAALPEDVMTSASGIAQWMGTTLFILLLIFLLAYFVRKTPIMRYAASRDMAVIGQLALGPRERLVHVRVAGNNLLVGVCANHISLICRLDGQSPPDEGGGRSFQTELERVGAGAAEVPVQRPTAVHARQSVGQGQESGNGHASSG